ncbi:HAUS augmin-like complex subunit 7 isoform X2 [Cyclopterus lumpus]|uniref:HAUS augmin-like complex subunit 7 isoform X2 n=1 Tax=Cyclopterus lumpus TaxID=8103 RepID=UPI001487566E|nr:HAUS augmin-like complex subunit 7 isoform X2 [Cyclopterus lumpus]
MAGALKEKQLVRHVYAELQAVSCPLVEGLYLQEADGMLQLLCVPSQHRTDILAWICSSVNPNFANSKTMAVRSSGPDVLTKEIAGLGQELMLCRADDLDLIRMLKPTLDPWPAHIKALRMGSKSSLKPSREEAADVAALLQLTQSTLQQLQSQCEFLSSEPQSPGVFSPSSLRVAACDLQLLMATFSHVFETDLRANCSRDAPSFSAEAEVFQRTHRLLLASITELEMLKEVSDASVSMTEEVNQLQTQPYYWSRGEKRKFSDQLEELTRRVQDLFPLLLSLDLGPKNPPNIS